MAQEKHLKTPPAPGLASVAIGKYRWRICALLFFATTINYMDRSVLGVLAPTLQYKVFNWTDQDYANINIAFKVAYAIGIAEPVSVMINTFGTGKISPNRIAQIAREEFDLRPRAIIETLDLLRPIYEKTAAYVHFGREEPEFAWERTDKAHILRSAADL